MAPQILAETKSSKTRSFVNAATNLQAATTVATTVQQQCVLKCEHFLFDCLKVLVEQGDKDFGPM